MELQMSWDGASLKRNRAGGPPVGLKNLGNSCYLNSVLQCLTYTPPLANFCLRKLHSSLCDSTEADRKRDCPFCIVEKRIFKSLSADLTLDAPMKIQSCLRLFSDHFRCGRQEDAHEFLRYVIDACHNTCVRLRKLRRSVGTASLSVVRDIFGGALQSQVKCLSCGSDSNKVDDIMDISLDVFHSNSLKDALQRFFQAEVLDGNNKYRCESCKKLVSARKQMSVIQAPNILVIQLKRFEGVFGGKIDKPIAFEEVLVLSNFMCKSSKDPRPEYKLFGTIVHSGFSPESGHYYAYIKDAMGRWYCCNDSFISLSTLQEVLSEKVYILFFSRTNQRPGSDISTGSTISNVVKYRDSNGHEASKTLRPVRPINGVNGSNGHSQPYGPSPRTDTTTVPKSVIVPSSNTPVKFSILGTSNSKGPLRSNGKVSKKPSMTVNVDTKETICSEKIEKSKLINTNGLNSHENGNGVGGHSFQSGVSTNGSGHSQSESINGNKDGCATNGELIRERGCDHQDIVNDVDSHVKMSGSKRKFNCALVAQDIQSRGNVERLKEDLAKEAASVLRLCGWSDKVCSFMSSSKRLRTQDSGISPLTRDELRKLLITDAKSTFLSQIPESLKGDLIKRLQSFSREK